MKKNDILLAICVILAAAAVLIWTNLAGGDPGAQVLVYRDGEQIAAYSLLEDGEHEIETEKGSNKLIIKDGKADMTEADCPDGLCVQQKEISKTGETIVCLPHKIVVEIEGAESLELDGITR